MAILSALQEALYSDAKLLEDTRAHIFPEGAHMAAQLLRLDDADRRRRALHEAHTRHNLFGGGVSANLDNAVSDLLALIAQDHEDDDLYAEAATRQYRAA
jgi:hypothetical protein